MLIARRHDRHKNAAPSNSMDARHHYVESGNRLSPVFGRGQFRWLRRDAAVRTSESLRSRCFSVFQRDAAEQRTLRNCGCRCTSRKTLTCETRRALRMQSLATGIGGPHELSQSSARSYSPEANIASWPALESTWQPPARARVAPVQNNSYPNQMSNIMPR
jgi:hypothetical protein